MPTTLFRMDLRRGTLSLSASKELFCVVRFCSASTRLAFSLEDANCSSLPRRGSRLPNELSEERASVPMTVFGEGAVEAVSLVNDMTEAEAEMEE